MNKKREGWGAVLREVVEFAPPAPAKVEGPATADFLVSNGALHAPDEVVLLQYFQTVTPLSTFHLRLLSSSPFGKGLD